MGKGWYRVREVCVAFSFVPRLPVCIISGIFNKICAAFGVQLKYETEDVRYPFLFFSLCGFALFVV